MRVIALISALSLAACAQLPPLVPAAPSTDGAEVSANADVVRPRLRPAGLVATSSDEDAPELRAVPRDTLVTLGNAAEPGLWVKTPIVASARAGRVTNPETGQSLELTLIPIEGEVTARSRASLAALQALGLPLTAISRVRVEPL